MPSKARGVRVPEVLEREIQREADQRGKSWSATTMELLTESLRMRRVPGIAFVDGTSGRRAVIAGTGLDVWEIIAAWKAGNESFRGLKDNYPWLTEEQLRVALGYYELFPQEIEARLELEATIATAGYSLLIVNAEVSGHRLADTLDIVFDAQGTRLAAQSAGASEQEGSSIEHEEYVDSLPRVFDTAYVNWYELEDSSFVPPDDETSDPSVTVVVEGVQYETEDGSLTEPRFAVEYLAPNTGEGEPTYEDLYTERSVSGPPENPNPPTTQPVEPIETQGLNCRRINASVTFEHVVDGVKRYLPKGTLVRVHDNNGWFISDHQMYSGYVSDSGRFYFSMPSCDTSTWWDYSKPDPYFVIVAKTNLGLTSHHGFLNRLHEWRTKTYWNQDSNDMHGKTIDLTTYDPYGSLAQRVWFKVNQVYNWEVTASDQYSRFNVDVFYPASSYVDGVVTSRAAIGRMLIVSGHGRRDDVLFHEFGHEVYYRRMYGESTYNYFYRQSIQSFQSGQFPACWNCPGHSYIKDIGGSAAMIEGWAGFFEAVTLASIANAVIPVGAITTFVENPDSVTFGGVSPATGLGAEIRVAAYLWDLWDNPALTPRPSTDGDPVSPSGSTQQRYSKIANYFMNMDVLSSLQSVWQQRIKPTLSNQEISDHCTVFKMNTLGAIDSVCK